MRFGVQRSYIPRSPGTEQRRFISRGPVHCVPDARLKCNFEAADERGNGRTDGREDGKLEAEESGSDDKGAPNVPIFR